MWFPTTGACTFITYWTVNSSFHLGAWIYLFTVYDELFDWRFSYHTTTCMDTLGMSGYSSHTLYIYTHWMFWCLWLSFTGIDNICGCATGETDHHHLFKFGMWKMFRFSLENSIMLKFCFLCTFILNDSQCSVISFVQLISFSKIVKLKKIFHGTHTNCYTLTLDMLTFQILILCSCYDICQHFIYHLFIIQWIRV